MLITKLEKITKSKNENNSRISSTLINHIKNNNIYNLTITELADLAKVNQSSVTRFIKQELNIKNYKKFVIEINIELRNYQDLSNLEDINDDISEQIVNDLILTLQKLDYDKIFELVKFIKNADRINVCAIGGGLTVKNEIEHKLAKIGKNVMFAPDWHQMLANIHYMKANDLVLFISYSGEKQELIKIATKAQECLINSAIITGDEHSTITNLIKLVISINSSDAKFRSFSFTSRICAIAVWEIVFKQLLSTIDVSEEVLQLWKWEN